MIVRACPCFFSTFATFDVTVSVQGAAEGKQRSQCTVAGRDLADPWLLRD